MPCDGSNEVEATCADHVIGCVEEVGEEAMKQQGGVNSIDINFGPSFGHKIGPRCEFEKDICMNYIHFDI